MSGWGYRIALAFGGWLVVAAVVRFFGGSAHPTVLALYVGVGAALVWLFLDVSADAGPEGAARLLGPELTSVVAAVAPYTRLTTAQMDLLLRRIEDL